eukprot:SRR837773.15572.p3 GENE.SRR837773.15572~~SRR837773.15572.p3  ORF type:complete len:106 (+),score=36.66 SRR837773.15572:828-1145(+)
MYLQEAHADDLWPLGYGISSHKSILDRQRACARMLGRHPGLEKALDEVGLDSMDDHFLHTYGAWPERYYLADLTGKVLWASEAPVVMDESPTTPDQGFRGVLAHV